MISRSLSAIALGAIAAAAPGEPVRAQARDSAARIERVAEGVYAIIHDDATDAWPHANTGVIVGSDGVVVVDPPYYPTRARTDIALIRRVTGLPIRYLVITHHHRDHVFGASAYRDAFPNLIVVSGRATRDYIAANAVERTRAAVAPGSERRTALAELERRLASGKDSTGRALSPDERARIATAVRQRTAELAEIGSLEVVLPTVVFDRELVLFAGSRPVELRNWGRANSPDDVAVYVPDARVLMTGDALVQSPLPYTGASWPVQWITVLSGFETVPVAAVIPGHGPVLPDHGYTRRMRELLEAVIGHVRAALAEGKTLEQAQREIDLDRLRVGPWGARGGQADEDWRSTVATLVERAWRGVRGQG